MMTASRQVDGVAKLLSKSDIERLKAPAAKPKVLEGECLGPIVFPPQASDVPKALAPK